MRYLHWKRGMHLKKGMAVFIGAWLGERLKLIFPVLLLLTVLMIVDYISGMLASRKEAIEHPDDRGVGWSSKKSIMGIYKKVGYILTVFVAFSIDYLLFQILSKIETGYESMTMFGFLVTIWLIVNELISILENAGRMGAVLPGFIKDLLLELKEDVAQKSG